MFADASDLLVTVSGKPVEADDGFFAKFGDVFHVFIQNHQSFYQRF